MVPLRKDPQAKQIWPDGLLFPQAPEWKAAKAAVVPAASTDRQELAEASSVLGLAA